MKPMACMAMVERVVSCARNISSPFDCLASVVLKNKILRGTRHGGGSVLREDGRARVGSGSQRIDEACEPTADNAVCGSVRILRENSPVATPFSIMVSRPVPVPGDTSDASMPCKG